MIRIPWRGTLFAEEPMLDPPLTLPQLACGVGLVLLICIVGLWAVLKD